MPRRCGRGWAARQILGRDPVTPEGRLIGPHAADRMVNPPPGRAPMSAQEVDTVLNTGNRVGYYAPGTEAGSGTIRTTPRIRVSRTDLPGRPSVIINPGDTDFIVTVIKNAT